MDDLNSAARAAEEFMRNNPMLSYAVFSAAAVFGWVARVLFAQGRKHWIKEFIGFFVVGVPIAAMSGVLAFEYMVSEEYPVRTIIAMVGIAIYVGSTLSLNVAMWLYDVKIKDILNKAVDNGLK